MTGPARQLMCSFDQQSAMAARLRIPWVQPELAALVDALPMPAQLLDRHGRTLCINQAWMEAARPGGLMAPTDGRGQDHVHELATGRGFAYDSARELAAAIHRVANGEQQRCSVLYELEDPDASYEAVVQHLDGPAAALLVHHERTGDVAADAYAQEAERLAVELEVQTAWRRDQNQIVHDATDATHGPLTPIRMRLHQMLHDQLGPITDAQRHALDQIGRNVDAWWNLQQAMLADLGGGRSTATIDLSALVEAAVHACRDDAIRSGVELVAFIEPDIDVVGNSSLLRQAVLMVVTHAVRRTPSGSSVRIDLEGNKQAILRVVDREAGADTVSWPGIRVAQEVAHAFGGTLEHDARGDGRTVEWALPMARASRSDDAQPF